jgi:hypothetical protein
MSRMKSKAMIVGRVRPTSYPKLRTSNNPKKVKGK